MGISLNKGSILGVSGSIIFFIIVLIIIMYNHSDFDEQLIYQVDNGVPADKLIPQIDKETEKMKLNAQRRLESNVINKNMEVNGELASKNDYESYMEMHENQMKMISNYDDARKKYAKREITKEQFLQDIAIPKEYMKLIN